MDRTTTLNQEKFLQLERSQRLETALMAQSRLVNLVNSPDPLPKDVCAAASLYSVSIRVANVLKEATLERLVNFSERQQKMKVPRTCERENFVQEIKGIISQAQALGLN